jgi:hypothetical protein
MKTTDSIPKKLTKKHPLECRKKHAPGERDEEVLRTPEKLVRQIPRNE